MILRNENIIDLKQVAGGGIFRTDVNYIEKENGGRTAIEAWDIIDDRTGDVIDRISVNLDNANGYETAAALA